MGAKGAALMLPFANTAAMQMHLDEISCNVAAKRPWRRPDGPRRVAQHRPAQGPQDLTIILLPSRSPELNRSENIWQYLRQNWLSTGFSKITTPSSRPVAKPGTNESTSPRRSMSIGNERLGDFRSIISAVGITSELVHIWGYATLREASRLRLVQDACIRRSAPRRSCDGIDVAMTTTVEVEEALRRVGREDDSRIDLAEAAAHACRVRSSDAPVDAIATTSGGSPWRPTRR